MEKNTPSKKAKRDPEGRREKIIAATVEVLAEVGVAKVTHRLIAARAQVPLGATTYYFPTLQELIRVAVDEVVSQSRQYLATWTSELERSLDFRKTLADLADRYVQDRSRAILEYEIYVAAARTEELDPLARVWRDEVPALLGRYMDSRAAKALSVFLNGSMLEAVTSGLPFDRQGLDFALESFLNLPVPNN
ncbi:TetR family transcriptional regulator [Arthrobacter sp. Cr_A7]|uniref:TetR/AcrR family transcriptional regulator n=1 Tax=Arthrobacter sp. Cr_A7 TaxID=3031017 RepID=UPI0023D9B1A0|nr:TetR family transcriptional regulator [Arthrobacter sp. Cr_A7]MDF2050281.1 TetR family transcriptional regulator [Arthrobacter sp. Cr_A7]